MHEQSTDVPAFLRPFKDASFSATSYVEGLFPHDELGMPAHACWWPSNSPVNSEGAIFVFIPGNPGLIEFYIPFLSAMHEDCKGRMAILAHGYLGHSPKVHANSTNHTKTVYGLDAQLQSTIEVIDILRVTFGQSARLILAGHSVGSWITMQVLKARPEAVASVVLLFPTLAHIASTPNGRRLSPLFRPLLRSIISNFSKAAHVLPLALLKLLFSHWPPAQLAVLRSFITCPASVYAALNMADDEMNTIQDLDVRLLQDYRDRIHIFFAEHDDWVGEQKEAILSAFHPDPRSLKIVHAHEDIPHAFCINHGDMLARQCLDWLELGELT
ncbi:alpha/beta-hydrolase [Obba rivulosa]|uniref:Alpha/beta-hydrolase n=1 Tax=Obba rivulosa TaxID=1052685 RepID=A0A8E2J4R2_9APHY|nr:alpha/beta-hydrolase [Obba rivulosa]